MGSRKRVYWKERKKEKLRTSARETFLISRRGTKKKGTGVWTVERQTQSPRHVTRVLPFLAAIVAIVRRSTANTSFPIVPVPPGRYLFPAARYPRYAPLTFKSIGYRGPRRRCATRVGNRAGRKNFSFSSPTFSESKRIYYLFLFFFYREERNFRYYTKGTQPPRMLSLLRINFNGEASPTGHSRVRAII